MPAKRNTIFLCGLFMALCSFGIPMALSAQAADDCLTWVRRDSMEGFLNAQNQPIFPLLRYRLTYPKEGLIIANSGSWEANPYSEAKRMCPRFAMGNSGLLNMKGEWVLPMASQYIGYWGNGLFWTCKGGKIQKYCSEPHHVEGGRYAIVNASGVLVDSLDDLAVPPDDGFSLLYRQGKIAVMDSTGRLRSGFEFDFALHWALPSYTPLNEHAPNRLWKTILKRDGHWYSLLPDASLLPLDWPPSLGVEFRTTGWRKRPAPWISEAVRLGDIAYPTSNTNGKPRPIEPKDLSLAENYPTLAQRNAIVKRLRDEDLRAVGLQVIEKADVRALADLKGKLLTPYGHQDFMAAGGDFVLQLDSLPIKALDLDLNLVDRAAIAYSWCAPTSDGAALLGVVDKRGKTIVPPIYKDIDVYPAWGLISVSNSTENHAFLLKGTKIIQKVEGSVVWPEKDLYVLSNRDMYEVRDMHHRVIYVDSNAMSAPEIVDGWLWYKDFLGWYQGRELKGKGKLGPYSGDSIPLKEIAFLRSHPEFDCARCGVSPVGDRWLIMEGDSVGLCDGQGKLLLPVIFDRIYLAENWIHVVLNGKEGVTDLQGKAFIPAEYDNLYENACGSFSVFKTIDGKRFMGLLDPRGKWIWEMAAE